MASVLSSIANLREERSFEIKESCQFKKKALGAQAKSLIKREYFFKKRFKRLDVLRMSHEPRITGETKRRSSVFLGSCKAK